jgi:hypothetical protein
MKNRNQAILGCCALVAFAFLSGAVQAETKRSRPRLTSTLDLEQWVGTYPCSNGLLKHPVLLDALKNVLGRDYRAYRKHMQLSGCGAMERRDGFLLMDVSQLHVGGYSSLIFVRLTDGMLFVFWLKSTVAEKQWQFYGPRPIPETVTQTVETEMNKEWGHVARFKVRGAELDIELRQ